tara:strand:+ start:50 stop:607 length:558 start_codon:yes stop_codon:yes gene_type:complete
MGKINLKKSTSFFFICLYFLVCASPLVMVADAKEGRYVLGPGDLLHITHLTRTELTVSQRISPDGSLHLPLLDRMVVSGLTLSDVQDKIKSSYAVYLKNPVLSISLTPRPIYVVQHDLKSDTFSVHEAQNESHARALLGNSSKEVELAHGNVYSVTTGRAPGFFEKHWSKLLSTSALIFGISQAF